MFGSVLSVNEGYGMLATLALIAVVHLSTSGRQDTVSVISVSSPEDMSRHKRHELHVAHLRYLASLHGREREPDSDADDLHRAILASTHAAAGVYSCRDLEALWDAAGGRPAAAFIAAEIAMAESGGRSWVISPTADYGLWQVNVSHGALASLNPWENVRAAIAISHDGSDWSAWTTYRTGVYAGLCLGCCRLTRASARVTGCFVADPFPVPVNGPFGDCAAASACAAWPCLFRYGWFLRHRALPPAAGNPADLTRSHLPCYRVPTSSHKVSGRKGLRSWHGQPRKSSCSHASKLTARPISGLSPCSTITTARSRTPRSSRWRTRQVT